MLVRAAAHNHSARQDASSLLHVRGCVCSHASSHLRSRCTARCEPPATRGVHTCLRPFFIMVLILGHMVGKAVELCPLVRMAYHNDIKLVTWLA